MIQISVTNDRDFISRPQPHAFQTQRGDRLVFRRWFSTDRHGCISLIQQVRTNRQNDTHGHSRSHIFRDALQLLVLRQSNPGKDCHPQQNQRRAHVPRDDQHQGVNRQTEARSCQQWPVGRNRPLRWLAADENKNQRAGQQSQLPQQQLLVHEGALQQHSELRFKMETRFHPLIPVRRIAPRRVGPADRFAKLKHRRIVQNLPGRVPRSPASGGLALPMDLRRPWAHHGGIGQLSRIAKREPSLRLRERENERRTHRQEHQRSQQHAKDSGFRSFPGEQQDRQKTKTHREHNPLAQISCSIQRAKQREFGVRLVAPQLHQVGSNQKQDARHQKIRSNPANIDQHQRAPQEQTVSQRQKSVLGQRNRIIRSGRALLSQRPQN
jgi:hypothetical protein